MFRSIDLVLLLQLSQLVFCLWPLPRSLQSGSTTLKLSSSFEIRIDIHDAPKDLLAAVARSKSFIRDDKHHRLTVGRGSSDKSGIANANTLSSLTMSLEKGAHVRSIAEESIREIGTRLESYFLTVPADGSPAVLIASSTLGLFRGVTTFEQLWYEFEGTIYSPEAPLEIYDSPAFPYRGFMLDTARNFFPVSDIKRTLDAMSWVKMSTFHWHIVDAQSFPLEISAFPELSQKGAYSASEIYTAKDVQGIVDYAGARGIDVLMEIDIPGHTDVISASHPEHIACHSAEPWSQFAAEPPAGQIRLASASTTNFVVSLLTAIAKTLPSKLFSTGGDEVNSNCYLQDAPTLADLHRAGRTLEQALDAFTQVTHGALVKEGKTPVVWEEMALNHDVTLSNQTVVMVWKSSSNAAKVASKGFRLIHAPSDYFYLDCGGGSWMGNSPMANSWCDPFKTWQTAYSFNPLALPESLHHLVLGGQQLLWTEQSSPENLDSIVWPRAAISAEVFWTGPALLNGKALNVTSALPRLHDLRYRMVQRGVRAIALQPKWCALRPGACDETWRDIFYLLTARLRSIMSGGLMALKVVVGY